MSSPQTHIFVTTGEPAGIGPDLLIQYAQVTTNLSLVVIASTELLAERARQLGLAIKLRPFASDDTTPPRPGELRVVDVPLKTTALPGQLDPGNARYVLQTLQKAVTLCQEYPGASLVTGPLHKGIINEAGVPFTGHTEYLAELSNAPQVVMMLACPGLRVALATTHLPLKQVSQSITRERLDKVIKVLHSDLQTRFGIEEPHILVCGLNPHAGEDGHLGKEEIEVIQPVLTSLRDQGMNLTGPLPADTLFIPKYLAQADAVLAMYHDQGLPVLKHMGFGRAINITLGLPFVRTSVDHGTALELAGTGQASTGSLASAIKAAEQLSQAIQTNADSLQPEQGIVI